MVGYAIHNIGNFTGDYNMQRHIEEEMRALSMGVNIGMGFAYGGIAGGIMATISTGINVAMEYIQGKIEVNKQNYEIKQLREISGLNALTNGSR